MADLSAAEGLDEAACGSSDFRADLWNLSWKCCAGDLCEHFGNCICMHTGDEWKYLQQYAAPHGSKYLVIAYFRICTGFVFHEIWDTDSDTDLSDSADQCGILFYSF